MSIVHTITEGGQIWTHRFRMFKQVIKITLSFSFLVGIIVFAICMLNVPFIQYQGSWYFTKSYLLENYSKEIEVDSHYWERTTEQRYSKKTVFIPTKRVKKASEIDFIRLKTSIFAALSMSSLIGNLAIVASLFFFLICGRKSKSKQHLSGRKISKAWLVALKLKLTRKASPISIGSIPLVKGSESQHMLITGGTGTGKTNCLHHILTQIRQQKHKAIIIDTTGGFIDRYYSSSKDIILSPFHDKSSHWHPWAECKTPFDFAEIAESFIPFSYNEHDNYWRQASRTVFQSMLQKFNDSQKTSELIRWILFEPLEKLCALLQGTKAASHMDFNSEKTASSIRSVASTFLECLECLNDTQAPFSIQDWISCKEKDSWLFLHCTPSQRTAVRPLLSTWLSSAIKGLLALEPDLSRRIWFIIDELPSLQKVKNIETLLTEGRKYGGCGILSLQSPSQLESIYGRESTKTIIGNTLTKVIFAEQDPEIAERISKSFGNCETKEFNEGISYGAHEARDGVNLSTQTKSTAIVSPSKILSLPKNTAFIKLPGSHPIVRVNLKISKN